MRNLKRNILLAIIVLLVAFSQSFAQAESDSLSTFEKKITALLSDSKVTAQLFLGYQHHVTSNDNFNEFAVKRGYITFRKSINPFLSGRITPDITIDREGDGEGDVEMRLKYCFMQLQHPTLNGFFTEPAILLGQVFTPFIEFEEKINLYRVEGAHFLDRIKQVSSADFGVTVTSLIGGKMDEGYQKRINKNHAGRYGSLALGVYNGGGYHSLEKNANKTIQWRLSVRPLPNFLPGFQASFTGALGKGNTSQEPDWNLYAGFLSYEHEFFALTGQYFTATGNHLGLLIDANGNSLTNSGYSFFADVRLFKKKVSLFGRWDYTETAYLNPASSSRYIGGVAYHILGKTKVVADYHFLDNSSSHPEPDLGIFELMFELAF
ncbi:MAG TPA: hypothetical protein PL017_03845 [Tenuifilaceae bacterium]|nr:hypothetical protein [Tenuifilaceae bacterium]HPE17686.1 hypothetical protein [Tenuifilaceae bacterium]HPJ45207.1 hypothetical protein [Tenuifilaceae bacterium]HPQ33436.1 hypothetical protein [Tenuifilaceae bacterium]HRX66924.1 hypothetical protein [Tenuifilaceae bacterium]